MRNIQLIHTQVYCVEAVNAGLVALGGSSAPVSTPIRPTRAPRIAAPDWSSTVPARVPRLVWACAAIENSRTGAILSVFRGRASNHRSLLRPVRPGLVDQKRQVVHPVIFTYAAGIDNMCEIILAESEDKICVGNRIVALRRPRFRGNGNPC